MAAQIIAFHLTDRCQLDCKHCLRDPQQKPKDIPLAVVRKVLAEAKSTYNSNHVSLTGGEPTLYPELEGVLDAIVEHDFKWHIVTNGRRFPSFMKLVNEGPGRRERLTAINFSLDGADDATHDDIRGEGSYRDVMFGATICTAYNVPFLLQMVINAKNAHQIESFGLLASELGAARVSFAILQATGTHHDDDLYLSPRAWRSIQDRIDRLRGALKLPVLAPEGFYREQPFHVCEPFASSQLHVDVLGRLNLCCQHSGVPSDGEKSDVAGDLAEMSLLEAHTKLLDIIHTTQAENLVELRRGPLSEWDHFPCNRCMKHFGKPHWSEGAADGPQASRERWRGAWAPKPSLPVVK